MPVYTYTSARHVMSFSGPLRTIAASSAPSGRSGARPVSWGPALPNKRLEPSPPYVEEAVRLIAQQQSHGLSLGAPGRVGRRGSGALR